jgi:hypothetical protein
LRHFLLNLKFQRVLVLKKAMEVADSTEREVAKAALAKIEILPGPDLILPVEKIKFDGTGMNRI